MAEREGFEPPCRLPGKTLSRRPRYDHFGTSPFFGARSRRFAAVPSGCSLGLTSLRSRFRRSLRSVRLRPLALVLALAAAASRRFPPAARLGSLRYARAFDARSAPFASGRRNSLFYYDPPAEVVGSAATLPMLELRTRLRRLLRQPAYLLPVLVSLGLGLAVSVAAFSAVNALIFRPLPGIADRDELIRIDWAAAATLVTSEEFRAIESQRPRSLTLLAAQGTTPLPVALPSGPETVSVAFVSSSLFETLGTSPVIGRFPGAADVDGDAPLAL